MILCWSGVSSTVAAGDEEILSARSATAAGVLNTDIRGNVDCNMKHYMCTIISIVA